MATSKVTNIYKNIANTLKTDEIKELIIELENNLLPLKKEEDNQYIIARAKIGLPLPKKGV